MEGEDDESEVDLSDEVARISQLFDEENQRLDVLHQMQKARRKRALQQKLKIRKNKV